MALGQFVVDAALADNFLQAALVIVGATKKTSAVYKIALLVSVNKLREIEGGLAIRSQPHNFPLIAKRLETEHVCHSSKKHPDGVGMIVLLQQLQVAAFGLPQGGGFTRPAAINHKDRRFIEPGQAVGTQGMRQMVMDEMNRFFWTAKSPDQVQLAAATMLFSGKTEK